MGNNLQDRKTTETQSNKQVLGTLKFSGINNISAFEYTASPSKYKSKRT